MNIMVLGASGRTGKHLVEQALAQGHTVTAFVHRNKTAAVKNPNFKLKTGDARNEADLEAALRGQDAVVSALGSHKINDDLIQRSAAALIAAMHTAGIGRIIMLSSFMVTPNYRPSGSPKLVSLTMRPTVTDKASGEALLERSDLDWTIVYATLLDKAPAGGVVRVVGPDEPVGLGNGIARTDVARFMLERLADPQASHRRLLITTK